MPPLLSDYQIKEANRYYWIPGVLQMFLEYMIATLLEFGEIMKTMYTKTVLNTRGINVMEITI